MKKVFVLIVLTLLALFAFNVGRINAADLTNETETIQTESEPSTEPVVAPNNVPEENQTQVDEPVTNATAVDEPVVAPVEGNTTLTDTPVTNETSTDDPIVTPTEGNTTVQDEPVVTPADGNETLTDENGTTTDQGSQNETILTEYENQTAKVIISKTNEEGELISGAKLQIVDSNGNVVVEPWISTDKPYEVMLPNGTYKLQELEAPDGYVKADDVEFVVKIEIPDVYANVDVDPELCDHYKDGQGRKGVVLYYVEIGGVKQEVYCINQQLGTPDGTAYYDGEILDDVVIRNYTRQEVNVDAHYNQEVRDISDQDLDNQELYDKLVDIIYHRHKATSKFSDLNETEIRYITELALKNYTNTGLTEVQRVDKDKVPTNYDRYDSYETTDGKYIWYLYPMYRSFVYLPDAPLGESIFTTNLGEGNAFGNLARHWSSGHSANTDPNVRTKVARYYELYQYLVGDDNNDGIVDHPSEMNLYIYSTETLHKYIYKEVEYTEPYQNLLGITGYFEEEQDIQKEYKVSMVNKYSTETRDITVTKEWDDNDNQDGIRPEYIEVSLLIDEDEVETVKLNAANNWTYTWKGLAKYASGVEIKYEVVEKEIKGYTTNIKDFTITNTHNPETRDITVNKAWDDKENYNNKRPATITIRLKADDVEIDSVKLDESNGWTYTWTKLDKFKNGKLINYTIAEDEVLEYDTEITGDMDTVFVVTNSYYGTGGDEPPSDNPKTGDNIYLYISMLLISLIGLVKYTKSYIKNNL